MEAPISNLIALVGDMNSHLSGELQVPPQTKFKIAGKLVTTVDTVASADVAGHPTGATNSATGSSKWNIQGKALHRHNDIRYCGASTVVTTQSKFTVGA